MEIIEQPDSTFRLGDYLKQNLTGSWTHFRAAVAFVKRSGTRHIARELFEFSRSHYVEIVAGIDHRGTSTEGLLELLEAVESKGRILVFHNPLPYTFHPKMYLFKSSTAAEVLIGSGNLTEGGLFTNYEASVRLTFDLADAEEVTALESFESTLDKWVDTTSGTVQELNINLLNQLTLQGLVPTEDQLNSEAGNDATTLETTLENEHIIGEGGTEHQFPPFVAHQVPRAPRFQITKPVNDAILLGNIVPGTKPVSNSNVTAVSVAHFVMTLQRTDVGVGQTTTGTSRRSPEIFIPLSARNAAPEFWDWPFSFEEDPLRLGKLDRTGVSMRLGTETINVNMMTWPARHDFRIRCEALRSAGNVGDILHLEKVKPETGYEYFAEIVPQGTSQYPSFLASCNQPVRNSIKRFGYY